MKTLTHLDHVFEFKFPQLDTLVRVERSSDRVVVRATRDSFNEDRKIRFIHELAAEGFIPDGYQWYSGDATGTNLQWVVERRLSGVPESAIRTARRFMIGLLAAGAVLFLLCLLMLFLRARP